MSREFNSEFARHGLEQERTGYVSRASANRQHFESFKDLLTEWQLTLELKDSTELLEALKLDGIVSQRQWHNLFTGQALPGEWLGIYLKKAAARDLKITPGQMDKLFRPDDVICSRVEINYPAFSVLSAGLDKQPRHQDKLGEDGRIRWPYPYASRTLKETVHSDFFLTLQKSLRDKYDPQHIHSDYELLKLVGSTIDTDAEFSTYGRVKITPLMLMGFARIPATITIEEFTDQLENLVYGTRGNENFWRKAREFYNAAQGIDLVTPFQSPEVYCESWEAFHVARINEGAGIGTLTRSKNTVSDVSLRLLEKNGVKAPSAIQKKATIGVLNCFPNLDEKNKALLHNLLVVPKDQNNFLGYLETLIKKRGVSYLNIRNFIGATYSHGALANENVVSLLMREGYSGSLTRNHLDQFIFALIADDKAYEHILSPLYKTQGGATPKGTPISQEEIDRLNLLYLEYRKQKNVRKGLFQTYAEALAYDGIPIVALSSKTFQSIKRAEGPVFNKFAVNLILCCTQGLTSMAPQDRIASNTDYLLGETWQFIWKKLEIPETGQITFLCATLQERANLHRVEGRSEHQRVAFNAGLSRIFQNALHNVDSCYQHLPPDQLMKKVLDAVQGLPFKNEALTASAISTTLDYLWRREGLMPTPDNPRTRERIDFVMATLDSSEDFKKHEAIIIRKMADSLIRSDKKFICEFGAALQDRQPQR